jgi:bla regulator protein BlaR1
MMAFLLSHLLESTVFCILLGTLAVSMRKGATARYLVLLMGAAKFAIPTVLLAKTGADIASFWPASSWLTLAVNRISYVIQVFWNLLPAGREAELLTVWVCGIAGMAAIWVMGFVRSKPVLMLPNEREQAALMRTRTLLHVRLPVRLFCTEEAVEPALRGVWCPVITVPKRLSDSLTEAEFDAVLLHELAHARRFDNLTGIFVHVLVCLFWFHPMLWLIERRLNVEREHACDEMVTACGMKPKVYAATILKVCQFHVGASAVGVSAMTGANLQRRVELILEGRVSVRRLYVPWVLVAALTIFMTFVPIAGGYCEQCGSKGSVDRQIPNKGEIHQ